MKYLDLNEFMSEGYLQEVNRLFFHPLGLALELQMDDETNTIKLSGIWDQRDDPEGIRFACKDIADMNRKIAKAGRIEQLISTRSIIRKNKLGFNVQPLTESALGIDMKKAVFNDDMDSPVTFRFSEEEPADGQLSDSVVIPLGVMSLEEMEAQIDRAEEDLE